MTQRTAENINITTLTRQVTGIWPIIVIIFTLGSSWYMVHQNDTDLRVLKESQASIQVRLSACETTSKRLEQMEGTLGTLSMNMAAVCQATGAQCR